MSPWQKQHPCGFSGFLKTVSFVWTHRVLWSLIRASMLANVRPKIVHGSPLKEISMSTTHISPSKNVSGPSKNVSGRSKYTKPIIFSPEILGKLPIDMWDMCLQCANLFKKVAPSKIQWHLKPLRPCQPLPMPISIFEFPYPPFLVISSQSTFPALYKTIQPPRLEGGCLGDGVKVA